MFDLPLLSTIIWLPILTGLLMLGLSSHERLSYRIAVISSLISCVLGFFLWQDFNVNTPAMQFTEQYLWIPRFKVYYGLGIDGIALPLILLTIMCSLLVVIMSSTIKKQLPQYLSAFLIMQGAMCGVFAATDAILFYVFWEAMLIPMFLIIGLWGGTRRVYATLKFFLYTFLGSVFMLVALIYLYLQTKSTMITDFYGLSLGLNTQLFIFIAFLLAFAVKIPMVPVHTWLPDAHVEAPTGGSVILAAIMLKIGAYGFLRFSVPIVPLASQTLAPLMITLSLIAIVYIGLIAIVQQDMKKLIAYSSIAHMGFATLGIFIAFPLLAHHQDVAGAVLGIEGAMVQLISHGFISAALFFSVGVLYDRLHTRNIADFGGVANRMPVFAGLLMLFALANVGLPGTSGFVGELLVILSAFKVHFMIAFLAAITLILAPAYTLWMYKRVMFGGIANKSIALMKDVTGKERLVLFVLTLWIVLLGVWPEPLIRIVHVSALNLVRHASGISS